jgi:NAD(P)H-flavin reductase
MLKPHGCVEPLLRRAMAYYRSEQSGDGRRVEFIYQILGRGTRALAALRPGDKVEFLGSLGNTYDVEAARGRGALLVAGGVGSAALFMLAEELRNYEISARLFIGGASLGDLCGLEDFAALLGMANVTTATIDGSHGVKGLVTAPLVEYLRTNRDAVIYACGPEAMLHSVSRIALEHRNRRSSRWNRRWHAASESASAALSPSAPTRDLCIRRSARTGRFSGMTNFIGEFNAKAQGRKDAKVGLCALAPLPLR